MPFSSFELNERLLKAIQQLGYQAPTPVQAQAIPAILTGKDLRVTAQTGSGKTAAFLLPILERLLEPPAGQAEVRALILVPTRELARQTLDNFKQLAQFTFIKAALLTGGEDMKKQIAQMRRVPDLLIATPGRLVEHLGLGQPLADVEIIVFDEADRMLDMGFSEDVSLIYQACCVKPDHRPQALLFSATRGGPALKAMVDKVLEQPLQLVINQLHEMAANTRQQIITVDDDAHREAVLTHLLAQESYERAIVFTNTKVAADRLYGLLHAREQKVFVLHGDKDAKDRKRSLEHFKQGTSRVLVATDVAARGLDLDGLDLVINYDMPRRGDEYVHRIGRTGRAGEDGLAISLIGHNDWNLMCSIERYLKQSFERRNIKDLKAQYQGPKKQKASGKAAGKKKKVDSKTKKKAPAAKRSGPRPSRPKVEVSPDLQAGNSSLKRKPKASPDL